MKHYFKNKKAICHILDDDDESVEDAAYKHLGHGMCRGANWQGKKWPVLRGLRTLQAKIYIFLIT